MKLRIGEKIFQVKKATTETARKKGLKRVKSMPKGAGLLLVLDEPRIVPITMEDCLFPLDLIFIKDNEVVNMKTAPVGSDDISSDVEVDSILEVNEGDTAGITVGSEVVNVGTKTDEGIVETEQTLGEGMHVLDEDGNVQVSIKGDERVFSRQHTHQLITLALQADASQDDIDYKKVGRAMVRMIDKQDTQDPQYAKN